MSLEQQLLRMQVDGWCILEGIIPEDCIAGVREHVQTVTEKHRNPNAPDRIGHVSGFINFDTAYNISKHILVIHANTTMAIEYR